MLFNVNRSKQRGISLLEVLLSLAVIAIILVISTRYYKSAQQSQQAGNALAMIKSIVTAETQYKAANNNAFGDLPTLTDSGYLPANFGIDPWGQPIKIGKANGMLTITVGPMPSQTCTILAGMVASDSASKAGCDSSNRLTATYQ